VEFSASLGKWWPFLLQRLLLFLDVLRQVYCSFVEDGSYLYHSPSYFVPADQIWLSGDLPLSSVLIGGLFLLFNRGFFVIAFRQKRGPVFCEPFPRLDFPLNLGLPFSLSFFVLVFSNGLFSIRFPPLPLLTSFPRFLFFLSFHPTSGCSQHRALQGLQWFCHTGTSSLPGSRRSQFLLAPYHLHRKRFPLFIHGHGPLVHKKSCPLPPFFIEVTWMILLISSAASRLRCAYPSYPSRSPPLRF